VAGISSRQAGLRSVGTGQGLQTLGTTQEGCSVSKPRMTRRRGELLLGGGAMRCRRHGEVLEVPPPEERGALVEKAHAQLGTAGVGAHSPFSRIRTWWPGMAREVKGHVAQCLQCDRVRSRVAEVKRSLQSLPWLGWGSGGPWTSLVSCPSARGEEVHTGDH